MIQEAGPLLEDILHVLEINKMKNRIYFLPDGSVEIEFIALEFQDKLGTELEVKKPNYLKSYPCKVMDVKECPGRSDVEHWLQLYHEGDGKIKIDKTWSFLLMPPSVIIKRALKNLGERIDVEMSKADPDLLNIKRLEKEKEKISNMNHIEDQLAIYSIALDGLERSDLNKQNIKDKIKDKIKSLKVK